MNTQQVYTNETIHIKVQTGEEIRRFVLPRASFEELISILRTLFGFTDVAVLKVRFLDEENDLITVTSDEELFYAAELSPTLLRLTVAVEESSTVQDVESTFSVEDKDEFMWKGGKGRRGQGRCQGRGQGRGHGRGRGQGRGCGRGRGRGGGKFQNLSYEDRLNMKSERLAQRIQTLIDRTEDGTTSKEQSRVLLWRLQKLQEKLEQVETTKQSMLGAKHEKSETLVPLATPTSSSGVWQCKKNLTIARKSGDREEVIKALAALKDAKCERKAQMTPERVVFLNEKKEAVILARNNLIASRKSGDKAQASACKEVLQQAKHDFKQAKWEDSSL